MFVQPTNEREKREKESEKEWRLKLGWARLKYTNWRRSFVRAIEMQRELHRGMAKVGVSGEGGGERRKRRRKRRVTKKQRWTDKGHAYSRSIWEMGLLWATERNTKK